MLNYCNIVISNVSHFFLNNKYFTAPCHPSFRLPCRLLVSLPGCLCPGLVLVPVLVLQRVSLISSASFPFPNHPLIIFRSPSLPSHFYPGTNIPENRGR